MLQATYRKTKEIQSLPDNPRIIQDEDFKILCTSIKDNPQYFEARPIILSDRTGVLVSIAGNQRLKAAKFLKLKEVPTILIPDLTEEKEREIIIRDNVSNGDWNIEILESDWNLDELEDWGVDVDFGEDEVLEAVEDDYEQQEQMQIDVVSGDLIEFVCEDGRVHRLLCGDSTCSDSMGKLMDGKKADMVFTDPPYNGKMGRGGFKKSPKLQKSKDTLVDSIRHLYTFNPSDFLKILEIFKGNKISVFIFCNKNLIPIYLDFCRDSKRLFDVLTWHKTNFIPMNNNTYYPDTEYLIKIKDKGAMFNVGIDKEIVSYGKYWIIDAPKGSQKEADHPTIKPQEIIKDCILICSQKGDVVLDFFVGSGSTMVAAHQLKRVCYGMELDEKYCQVIIDRMQKLDSTLTVKINGKQYKKEGAEVPF